MESKPSFAVRRPEIEDLDKLVDLYFSCYSPREHLAMCLGKSFMRDVFRWFLTSEQTFVLVADQNGKFLGFLTVCNGPYHKLMFLNNKKAAMKAFLLRPWILFDPKVLGRFADALFKSDSLHDGEMSGSDIAHCSILGVHPQCRTGGVASIMIGEMVKECGRRKWTKMRAAIYKTNMASRRLMLKLGWEELPLSKEKVISVLNLGGK
jgi:ribosomal protein S18 acetylase RimI-like enzyme